MTTIFNVLGNSSAQIRLMCYLIGTKDGFDLNSKEIQKRTGLNHASYLRARKGLEERGWIETHNGKLIIHYSKIRDSK